MNHTLFETESCWYVYTLRGHNGTLYSGCTQDLTERVIGHNLGHTDRECDRWPPTLLGFAVFRERHKAAEYERYLTSVCVGRQV